MGVSNRPLFVEAAKTRTFTLKEIEEIFEVSAITARNWSRLPHIEQVPASSPMQFRAKVNVPTVVPIVPVPERKVEPETIKGNYIELHEWPGVDAYYEALINDELPPEAIFNFNEQFKKMSSKEDVERMKKMLKSAYLLVQHFERINFNG